MHFSVSSHGCPGTPIRDYIWLDGEPLAQIDISNTGESIHYLHTDHLGTARYASDAAWNIVWRWEGEAFGNTAPDEDPDADGVNTQINLRFPGQYADVETGFYYNYFRYYDPSTGRYITSDPIGLDGGINTYGYVGGNPLLFADRYGLLESTLPWNAIPRFSPTIIPKPMVLPKSPWLLLIVPTDTGNGECIENPSCEAAYAAMINSVPDGNVCLPVNKNKSSNDLDCSAVRRNCIKECLPKLDSPDLQSTPFHKCVADCLFDAGC